MQQCNIHCWVSNFEMLVLFWYFLIENLLFNIKLRIIFFNIIFIVFWWKKQLSSRIQFINILILPILKDGTFFYGRKSLFITKLIIIFYFLI